MSFTHLLAALLVVALWGFNFIAIKVGLRDLPPVFFTCIRFIVAAVPAMFFVPRPKISCSKLIAYGFFAFALQFSLLFIGMKLGMSAGLSSLVMQSQAFFTIGIVSVVLKDRPHIYQLIGALIAGAGIVLVGLNIEAKATLVGLFCIICGGFSWGIANTLIKTMGSVSALSLVVWGSAAAVPPLCIATLWLDGPVLMQYSLTHLTWLGIGSVLYNAYFSTLLGFGIWAWLLRHHSANLIAPFTLLVPIVGIVCGALLLDESFYLWELAAAALVMSGLTLNVFGGRIFPPRVASVSRS